MMASPVETVAGDQLKVSLIDFPNELLIEIAMHLATAGDVFRFFKAMQRPCLTSRRLETRMAFNDVTAECGNQEMVCRFMEAMLNKPMHQWSALYHGLLTNKAHLVVGVLEAAELSRRHDPSLDIQPYLQGHSYRPTWDETFDAPSPLQIAAGKGDVELVSRLLSALEGDARSGAQAEINKILRQHAAQDSHRMTPMATEVMRSGWASIFHTIYITPLVEATMTRGIAMVSLLLQQGAKPSRGNPSAMDVALLTDQHRMVEIFLLRAKPKWYDLAPSLARAVSYSCDGDISALTIKTFVSLGDYTEGAFNSALEKGRRGMATGEMAIGFAESNCQLYTCYGEGQGHRYLLRDIVRNQVIGQHGHYGHFYRDHEAFLRRFVAGQLPYWVGLVGLVVPCRDCMVPYRVSRDDRGASRTRNAYWSKWQHGLAMCFAQADYDDDDDDDDDDGNDDSHNDGHMPGKEEEGNKGTMMTGQAVRESSRKNWLLKSGQIMVEGMELAEEHHARGYNMHEILRGLVACGGGAKPTQVWRLLPSSRQQSPAVVALVLRHWLGKQLNANDPIAYPDDGAGSAKNWDRWCESRTRDA